jgi:hypothetical protein
MLAVRVIVGAERREGPHLLQHGRLVGLGQVGNAARHHYAPAAECVPEGVVELANSRRRANRYRDA